MDFKHETDSGKSFSNLRALAALHGFPCFEMADGKFLLTVGGWCREIEDLRQLRTILGHMGVKP